VFFDWFRLDDLDVPIVFTRKKYPELTGYPDLKEGERVKKVPFPVSNSLAPIWEMDQERISIKNVEPHRPLLIKASYHPNWRVIGAQRVYMCSPGFMLVIPEKMEIELQFERGIEFYVGLIMSFLGILCVFLDHYRHKSISHFHITFSQKITILLLLALIAVGGLFPLKSPEWLVMDIERLMAASEYSRALEKIERYDQPKYHLSIPRLIFLEGICLERLGKKREAIGTLERIVERFPDTDLAGNALHELGRLWEEQKDIGKALSCYRRGFYEYHNEASYWALNRLEGGGSP
jgi:hypothetical protein